MRRARGRRGAAAFVAVPAAVALLGGCGIQETDVIEAGGPASFQAFLDRDYDMLLFFRSPDGGLSTVIRTTGSPSADTAGPVPTEKVVSALLAGPREEDRAAGLTTALPTLGRGDTVKVEPAANGRVTTHLPIALKPLDDTALRQLTCTIAYSQDADGQIVVELRGQDGTSRSGTCQLAPGGTSLPETGD
ncbi:hypothetical protein [Streptomyces muensis]|uniref:Lipoprotein n=1 Tax=Streptomyces muensis TaxID=1077944 RepID=A0A9X1PXN8_STRM4|nr:hypothetical protein [Streptomyces muensis]MCF1593346.1 hypothetical protein [Streptomyces muensis]